MAVKTGLITAIAEIDLQRFQFVTIDDGEIGFLQQRQGGTHKDIPVVVLLEFESLSF
jgi:hypothetical protein